MNALANRIGNYHYADGFRKKVTFGEGRTFSVVLSSAYNAGGLIGSEVNGIVVFDEDHASVVLDRHMLASVCPSQDQVKEFQRIAAITDWKEFTGFLRSNRRYRDGSVPDIDADKPDSPDEAALVFKAIGDRSAGSLGGPEILPANLVTAHNDASLPYAFPDRTRLDIVKALAGHTMHGERYSGSHLAWNIKVGSFDTSGKHPDYNNDPAYDALWDAVVEKDADGSMFYQAAEDALSYYVDGNATAYGSEEHGKFEFGTQGRSGGWLVLTKFDGAKLSWPSQRDMIQDLLEMDENDLVDLYAGVKTFDATIDPKRDMAYQYAAIRSSREEEWKESPETAEALAEELDLEGWVHPARATPSV